MRKHKSECKCSSCRSRAYRKKFPIKYAFTTLKSNAKRRGIEFSLTIEYFTLFCTKTNYIRGKGKTSESYSIDRIDINKGYVEDNIQILTLRENTQKMHLEYCWQTKTAKVIKYRPIHSDENPF